MRSRGRCLLDIRQVALELLIGTRDIVPRRFRARPCREGGEQDRDEKEERKGSGVHRDSMGEGRGAVKWALYRV